ncbi:CDGSH iron-sulfur domain-containing protein [Candidatus Bipolaricaulota bacterium]
MRSRIFRFESEDIIVNWDYVRCIHVEACIRSLPVVFDRHQRPWINPTKASAEEIVVACEACPTGALHYERLDDGPAEKTPDRNSIIVSADGPLFIRGDLNITDEDGGTILRETRAALCRCGQSRNKPLCDGSHREVEFSAESRLTAAALERGDGEEPGGGVLTIQAANPGPLLIRGSAELGSDGSNSCAHVRVGAFCCCGKSKTKPFCDGSHAYSQS